MTMTVPLEGTGGGMTAAEFRTWIDRHADGNQSEAARLLGISRPTVMKCLKEGAPKTIALACKGHEAMREKLQFNVTLDRNHALSRSQEEIFRRHLRVNRPDLELNSLRYESRDWFRYNPRLSFPWYVERDHADKLTEFFRETVWDAVTAALEEARD